MYGAFGLILAYLLQQTLSAEPEMRAAAIGIFVISAMLLRFLVGEIVSGLNALRLINTGYPMARHICDLYDKEFDV